MAEARGWDGWSVRGDGLETGDGGWLGGLSSSWRERGGVGDGIADAGLSGEMVLLVKSSVVGWGAI